MTCVTVVLPAFQAAATIERALNSLRHQEHEDWRAIVIDDGSTDDTTERALSSGDKRINVLRQSNAGSAAARNAALQLVTTDYVGFLDADDEWLPNKLRLQIPYLAYADFVYADCDVVNANGASRPYSHRVRPMPPSADPLAWLLSRPNPIPTLTVVARTRDVLSAGGFPPEYRGPEDLALWLALADRGAVFARLPRVVARYHLGPDSLSSDASKMLREEVELFKDQTKAHAGTYYGKLAQRRTTKTLALERASRRRCDSTMPERWRDLKDVMRGRRDPRALTSQLAYTVLPRIARVHVHKDRRA